MSFMGDWSSIESAFEAARGIGVDLEGAAAVGVARGGFEAEASLRT
jgi:hypothetical protein